MKGLIPLKRSNIISEYCVLREIIWQCCILHNSVTYHFVGDQLLPKEDVSIASVRPVNIIFLDFFKILFTIQYSRWRLIHFYMNLCHI